MTDEQILDVIADALDDWAPPDVVEGVLTALRDAGYVADKDTIALGEAVQRLDADGDTFVRRVYAEAGVERKP